MGLFGNKPFGVSFLQNEDQVKEVQLALQKSLEELDRYELENCVIYLKELNNYYISLNKSLEENFNKAYLMSKEFLDKWTEYQDKYYDLLKINVDLHKEIDKKKWWKFK